jgi:hypothetical protein
MQVIIKEGNARLRGMGGVREEVVRSMNHDRIPW